MESTYNINNKIGLIMLFSWAIILPFPLYATITDSISIWKVQKFSKQHVYDISQDNTGFIRITTSERIFRFDGRKFNTISPSNSPRDSFHTYRSGKREYVDSNGNKWQISKQGNINVYSPTNGWIAKKKLTGKTSDSIVIYDIFEDNHHFIWFASNIGLFRLHLKGTIPTSVPSSKLVFTRFSTYSPENNRILHQKSQINNTKQIIIPAKRKFLEVEFSYPAFLPTGMPKYHYRLGDSNEAWIPLDSTNVITFHDMEYGKQQLWVKAEISGSPNQTYIISKKIHTNSFFWETPYFSLCFASLFIMAFLIYLYQRKQYFKKKREFRNRISCDLHDEVGSTLTRISLCADLLATNILQPEEQEKTLMEVSSLNRNILSIINDVIWFEGEGNSTINSLIHHMKEEGGQLASIANIHLSLNTDNLEGVLELPPNYSRNIYLIYKEALNNVIKHSNATHVNVQLSRKDGKYLLIIDDNGTQSTGSIKKGQGLTNMVLRAEKINGTINIRKENGYTIELEVPTYHSSSSKFKGMVKK